MGPGASWCFGLDDGVVEYSAEFWENATGESFISFMRHQTGDWVSPVSIK